MWEAKSRLNMRKVLLSKCVDRDSSLLKPCLTGQSALQYGNLQHGVCVSALTSAKELFHEQTLLHINK